MLSLVDILLSVLVYSAMDTQTTIEYKPTQVPYIIFFVFLVKLASVIKLGVVKININFDLSTVLIFGTQLKVSILVLIN